MSFPLFLVLRCKLSPGPRFGHLSSPSRDGLNLEVGPSKWDVDASYVRSNALKLTQHEKVNPTKGPLAGAHGDVWHSIQRLLQQGSLPLPHKVESHLCPDLVGEAVSPLEYFMNGIADALASLAVRIFDYPEQIQKQADFNARTVFLVNMRLAIIEKVNADWAKRNKIVRVVHNKLSLQTPRRTNFLLIFEHVKLEAYSFAQDLEDC